MAEEQKADMNQLIRRAASGVPDEELAEYLKKRERQRKYRSMNHLLRAARGHEIPDEDEGDK